jgi:succinylarginine dihydrolase
MWAANAATVSPAADTADGRTHFSPANLISQLHRSIEASETAAVLRQIFADESAFAHHPPLPPQARFADEGAANHMRLCADYAQPGLEVFIFGRSTASAQGPKIFPARQTLEASQAIARRHGLSTERCAFVQQNPAAIDAGVFHNDVAAVGNQQVLLCHAHAFADQGNAIAEMREKFAATCGRPLHVIEVTDEELTLAEAVATYLFNSQIVTPPDGRMALIAPAECRDNPRARAVIDRILAADTPIRAVHYLSVRQSMRNGGGPACLRLRVVLNEAELARTHRGVFLDDPLYARLVEWVNRHYRAELRADELGDVRLLEETRAASAELRGILELSN